MKIKISSILTKSKSKIRFILPLVGLYISLVIIGSVYQLYGDLGELLSRNKSSEEYEYIQISKEIGISNALGFSSNAFSKSDIKKIESKDFISDVGELYSNDFRVYGKFAGNSFDMFFNSVEDDFIDADLNDFIWEEGEVLIPLIISNQFLAVLNNAVLPSQGQAPIPKFAIKQATVQLLLSKNGRKLKKKARVVGFSDRISSVLVPKKFLDFANKKLSGKSETKVTMLMLKVKDSSSNQLRKFLSQNDFEVSGELPLLDNARLILKITIQVLLTFGILLLLISGALNIAQYKLIVLENKERLRMLILLGYSPSSIIKSLLSSMSLILNLVLIIGCMTFWLLFTYLHKVIKNLKLGSPEISLSTFLVMIGVIILFQITVGLSIKKQIK